jgi:hypothetical protein
VRTIYEKEADPKLNREAESAQQIGINYIESAPDCWCAFADIVASKMLTGKCPEILQTITLKPVGVQEGLKPHMFMGDPKYTIDPTKNDMYVQMIEMRSAIKKAKEEASKAKEQGIKLAANATSYGALIEFNVDENTRPTEMAIYFERDCNIQKGQQANH